MTTKNNFKSNFKYGFILIIYLLVVQTLVAQESINEYDFFTDNTNQLDPQYIDEQYTNVYKLLEKYPDSAYKMGLKLIDLSTKANYAIGKAKGNELAGRALVVLGKFKEGRKHADITLKIAQQTNAHQLFLFALNIKGASYFRNKEFDKVFEINRKGYEYALKHNLKDKQKLFTINAASLLSQIGDTDQALLFFKESLGLLDNKDDYERAQVRYFMSQLYTNKDSLNQARALALRAQKYFSKQKNAMWEAKTRVALFEIFRKDKGLEEALNQIKIADSLTKDFSESKVKIDIALAYALINYDTSNTNLAFEQALKIEERAKAQNYHSALIETQKLLYTIYEQREQYKKANSYYKNFNQLQDSIKIQENSNKLKLLLVQNNLEKEKEIIALETAGRIQKKENLNYIFLLLVITLIIILGIVRINNINQRKANFKLAKLNNDKAKIFSIIGHDLKSPIGTLQQLMNLYNSNTITEKEIKEFAPELKQKLDYSGQILNNLLYWSRTQMEGLKATPTAFYPTQIIEKYNTSFNKRITEKKITIRIENQLTEEKVIFIDENHFEIIFRNLFTNAIKFTPENGTVTINLSNSEQTFKLMVMDTGTGMSQKKVNEILKGEYVESTYGTNSEKGTGIGLTLCKELIKLNNGELIIESSLGKGSTFKAIFYSK